MKFLKEDENVNEYFYNCVTCIYYVYLYLVSRTPPAEPEPFKEPTNECFGKIHIIPAKKKLTLICY